MFAAGSLRCSKSLHKPRSHGRRTPCKLEYHARELTGINASDACRHICPVFSIVATIRADLS
jgi:hypothetical protein